MNKLNCISMKYILSYFCSIYNITSLKERLMKNLLRAFICLTVICSLPACKYFDNTDTKVVEVKTPNFEHARESLKDAADSAHDALANSDVKVLN